MSFLRSLTGSLQKGRINQAYGTANAAYDDANAKAKGYLDTGHQGAKGYIDAGGEGAQKGGELYRDTLGINGADAIGRANDVFLGNNILQQQAELVQKRRAQVAGARLGSGDGADKLARERAYLGGYRDWQNQLAGEEARGDQFTMAGANNENSYGQNQANREMSYGSAKAGSAIGQGSALAANDSTGINNLFKALGLGVQAYTGFSPNKLSGGGGGYGK